jgi:hypothetical protein
MNFNLTQLAPYIWIVGVILVIIVAFVVIRFFWQHILKYIVHGCLGIAGVLVLLALLHYVFKIF